MTNSTISTTSRFGLAVFILAAAAQGWAAPRFSPAAQPLGSISPMVLSNTDLSRDLTKAYRPWFENGAWQGDIVEYTVTKNAGLSSSVDLSTSPPGNSGSNWSARLEIAEANSDPEYWMEKRRIITWDGTQQVGFFSAALGEDNVKRIDPSGGVLQHSSKILNYVRGDRSQEYPSGLGFRKRSSILGDVIHSTPVYVGPPLEAYLEVDYQQWADARFERVPVVYAGANDGMLHAFEAATGREIFAYVPSMLFEKLRLLTVRPYQHTYFVDGEITVRDAYFDDDWHSVLVGTLGAGGRGFFALDVSAAGIQTDEEGIINKALFEFGESHPLYGKYFGDSFSRGLVAKLNDGEWYVVIGNGYNSHNGVATLFLVNLETRELSMIPTVAASDLAEANPNPNGLSSPALLDANRDGKADYAYAGDIDGNLWKFDLSDANPANWKEAYGRPLHEAVGSAGERPITVAPQLTRHPISGFMVYFGTGRLYTTADLESESVQALYGIRDSGQTPPGKADQSLLAQTWDGPKTYTDPQGNYPGTQTIAIYNEDAGSVDWSTQHGWKVEFPPGYRVLQPLQVRSNRVKATVYHPRAGKDGKLGANWLLEAATLDGGPNPKPIFDLNVDTLLNANDLYKEAEGEQFVPMMWRQPDGIMSQVTLAVVGSGVDAMFINYLQPPYTEPCAGDCPNGFQRGDINVATWQGSVALGGLATQNTGQYDKAAARVYVDFFDLNVPKAQGEQTDLRQDVTGQVDIDTAGNIPENEEFIVLVANADLTPGATLRIGNQEWNALDYQRHVHQALLNWDPGSPDALVPESLIWTWGAINVAGGTISLNFNDDAIRAGGIHPTQPECVVEPISLPLPDHDRWRNGALTIQLVKKSHFTGSPAISMVDIQQPADLATEVTLPDGTLIKTSLDETVPAQYRTIGGLLAKGSAEHIWESTLFWHFGDLAQIAGLGRPCYGEPNWAAAVALELSANPVAEALKFLDVDSSLTLQELIAQKEACGPNGSSSCLELYQLLQDLAALASIYELPSVDGTQNDGETPVNMNGGARGAGNTDTGSFTEGQTFERGRASWTDLVN